MKPHGNLQKVDYLPTEVADKELAGDVLTWKLRDGLISCSSTTLFPPRGWFRGHQSLFETSEAI